MPFRTNDLCIALAEGAGICGALKVLWEVITMYACKVSRSKLLPSSLL